jgi:hypothetical protein
MQINDQQTASLLKERLIDEERKNFQLSQYIQQIKQQHATLMSHFASSTTTSVNNNNSNSLGNKQQQQQQQQQHESYSSANNSDLNLSFLDNSNAATNLGNSNLLMEATSKDTRMKQLEIQVQQLQDELNVARSNLAHQQQQQRSSNENFNDLAAALSSNNNAGGGGGGGGVGGGHSLNSANHSTHVSPHHQYPVNSSSSSLPNSASNLSTQIELLKTNEKFLKEKVNLFI